eukprot:m.256398 g.256398  ORF g.256398 m.256398 type:complete len:312 (+) comp15519_c0_seq7:773-1708(+)
MALQQALTFQEIALLHAALWYKNIKGLIFAYSSPMPHSLRSELLFLRCVHVCVLNCCRKYVTALPLALCSVCRSFSKASPSCLLSLTSCMLQEESTAQEAVQVAEEGVNDEQGPTHAKRAKRGKPDRRLCKKDRKHARDGMFFVSDALYASFRHLDTLAEATTTTPGAVRQCAEPLYDRVLVDAECTHDGSIKHIAKYDKWGWETFEKRFFDPERISTLQTLQRNLIQRGFDLLKPGGRLVYSTCSFARRQNEDIVSWFLSQNQKAELVPAVDIAVPASCPSDEALTHCLKFDPVVSGTSGLFVAAFAKHS